LRDKGCNSTFLCREHPGHLIKWIRSKGHAVQVLPVAEDTVDAKGTAHAAWLGATQDADARISSTFLKTLRPAWLIVDHYALDYIWECQIAKFCKKILVIDDLADRKHVCHMLLDQNWHGTAGKDRYNHLLDRNVRQLLGPQYALLGPEYRTERLRLKPRNGVVKQILVFMGGSDPANTTELVLSALSDLDLAGIKIKVVVGVSHACREELLAGFSGKKGWEFFQGVPSLANLMRESDLMIGAGGSTNWERMCMGLPSVILSVANNQVEVCELLAQEGYINYLGKSGESTLDAIRRKISILLDQSDAMCAQSLKMMTLVDGLGTDRVCHELSKGV